MYPSRGNNAYGQQSYGGGQSGYTQNLGTAYSGSSVGGLDAASQQSLASRHSSMLGASQEADAGGYRGHASAAAHYGGQFGSIYGSAGISGAQQASAMTTKGSGSLVLEGRGGYSSGVTSSPKFAAGEYVPSSHGYGPKSDQLYAEKIPDYPTVDRRQYGERQSAYMGRDMQGDPAARYADSVGFGHHRQPEMYERIDQGAMLRQEKLLKSQSMQSASLDGGTRQIDYLAARSAASRHPAQDLASYGGRIDADPRSASLLSSSTYAGQNTPSILGAAPRKSIDDLLYPQSSSNPGYGVSLPPGRDYGTGKGLHATSLEADYAGGHLGMDDRRDDRPSYLREFELREEERRRELLREREKDRERERERERERDRERERERERERKRERERMLERREKERERERERERKRAIEVRHERTPMRASRDRRASSLMKDGRVSYRDSPSHEAAHRRHSPVKEKKREYVCKVHTFSLVDVERDYLSLDKRYPRLFVSPELSKAVVNWPRENFKLSIHTPVSFEHDFVEDEGVAGSNGPATKVSAELHVKPEFRSTVWNAKIILMSGLSKNALEDLSSDRILDDRIPHICNILRFAILKRDHAFMAIGGPCDVGEGGDPAVDDAGLIQTALRYAKDVAQLDLQRCHNWNRFLEIHYDRYGEDGFFSHKEVTVLFVPDLSECLPSLDMWRDQWLAHKNTIADREHQLSLKKERPREKEVQKDKGIDSKRSDKAEKVKDFASSVDNKKEKGENNVKGKAAVVKGDEVGEKFEKVVSTGSGEEAKNVSKDQVEATVTPKTDSVKTGKKKIIRRIVKQKVVDKTADAENSPCKQNEASHENAGGKNGTSDISVEQSEASADPSGVKTFVRKKIIKKVPVGKATQNDDEGSQNEAKADKEMVCSEDKVKDVSGAADAVVIQGSGVKTTIKKKIIKRVLKRKLTGAVSSGGTSETKDEKKLVVSGTETKDLKQMPEGENQATEVNKPEKKIVRNMNSESPTTEKKSSASNSNTTQGEAGKEEKNGSDGKSSSGTKVGKEEKNESDGKSGSGSKVDVKADKQRVAHKDNPNEKGGKSIAESSKDEKRDRDGKDEPMIKSSKEVKEKRKPEEPPRHPGLILQTKGNKETKLRSLSLSLDSLLDYTDKDIEESTFELSLFAETLHEMLQYQMGSRLLTFLQKLRIKFVTKRNQQKRQRGETDEKDKDRKSAKRPKTTELPLRINSANVEMLSADQSDDKKKLTEESAGQSDDRKNMPEKSAGVSDDKNMTKEGVSSEHINEAKLEEESHDEEDPEEDPEEYEEMEDPEEDEEMEDPSHENKIRKDEGNTIADAAQEPVAVDKKDIEEATKVKDAETKSKSGEDSSGKGGVKVETGKKEPDVGKEVVVDKELLEAFRFFDRNRIGFIRVEDMRLIIHNLGKFLPHRDVKDLVQSALLMSNTGRDDRIIYNKLVKMSGL